MQRFLQALKTALTLALAGGMALFALLLIHTPVFPYGEGYELYAEAFSGQVLVAEDPLAEKLSLGRVAGESVRYEGDRAEELIRRFGATLLFTEEACGTVNYYLYAPTLGGGVSLKGERVNLHIAVRGERTAVGTPLIFGGF